jgi:hypothetical protein
MIHEDDEPIGKTEFVRVDQSYPPLRWIANILGSWGGHHILMSSFAEDDNRLSLSKFHGFIFRLTFPIYEKWGTYYKYKDVDDF